MLDHHQQQHQPSSTCNNAALVHCASLPQWARTVKAVVGVVRAAAAPPAKQCLCEEESNASV
jgi:hypothetical protein